MIEASYRHCRQLTRRAESNFYAAFRLFPRHKRRAMFALYAFSRCADDLGDSQAGAEVRREELNRWRMLLEQTLAGQRHGGVWPALHDAVNRFAIPTRHLFEIIDGVAMDLVPPSYQTFEELQQYCYHVASAVGLACIHVWGFADNDAEDLAKKCGIAFQMTNILRDLHEDALLDRVYLPHEDLNRFRYDPSGLRTGANDERFRKLLQFQIARTERFYEDSAPLVDRLSPDCRRGFAVMFSTYRSLLNEIKRREAEVLHERVELGRRQKVGVLLNAWLRPSRVACAAKVQDTTSPAPRSSVANRSLHSIRR